MKNKSIQKIPKNFFFCPASDYLNQNNESGSHGKLSYEFIRHLSMKSSVHSIFGLVMMSMPVDPIPKTKFDILIKRNRADHSLNGFDSFYFYISSYFKYRNSDQFHNADVVHHIIPFKFGRTFNLFFICKKKSKQYIIGPIVSPHINEQISSDEEYVFIEKKSLWDRITSTIFTTTKVLSLRIFGSILFQLSLMTLQNADTVFFSDNYSLEYHKPYLNGRQKVHILDTGINVDTFKPIIKPVLKRKNNVVRILFVGRLTRRKGCEFLIQALHEVLSKRPNSKIQCEILGYGPLKEELEEMVKKFRLSKYIHFLPGVKNEELVTFYHRTDIICIPALSDTFTVIKEGMASGKPVIVTDVCSHAERVTDGVDGFIVSPRDAHAIANVLFKIIDDPRILNTLSKNAPRSSSRYDWNLITDRYLEIVENRK